MANGRGWEKGVKATDYHVRLQTCVKDLSRLATAMLTR